MMPRRFDSLSRMLLTLLAAVVVGLLLEAEGLKVWADRLEVGAMREFAQPLTQEWHERTQDLGITAPRRMLLAVKAVWSGEAGAAPVIALAAPEPLPPPQRTERPPEPATPALPEVATAPASIPLEPRAPPLTVAGKGVQIALAGDSMMAVGLAPTLRRGLGGEQSAQIIKAYRSGTGLARPEVFDWLHEYPQVIGEARPAIVICSLGANDGQNVPLGKQVLEFGTPAWDRFYRERLTAYLDLLTRGETRVLWVGMPVMRAPSFARKMEHMNALVQEVLKQYPNVTWLDPNPVLGHDKDGFVQYRANARGKLIKVRADDGIHMTDDGALFLLPAIRNWLASQPAGPALQAGLGTPGPAL